MNHRWTIPLNLLGIRVILLGETTAQISSPACSVQGNCPPMIHSLGRARYVAVSSFLVFTLSPVTSLAQGTSPEPAQTQSSNNVSTSASSSRTHATSNPSDLEVSWRKMPARFLHDEKDMWLFPVKLAEGKNWLPAAIVIGGTAAFIKEAPPLERKVRQTDIFSAYNKVLKSSVSGGLVGILPVGFFLVGLGGLG